MEAKLVKELIKEEYDVTNTLELHKEESKKEFISIDQKITKFQNNIQNDFKSLYDIMDKVSKSIFLFVLLITIIVEARMIWLDVNMFIIIISAFLFGNILGTLMHCHQNIKNTMQIMKVEGK